MLSAPMILPISSTVVMRGNQIVRGINVRSEIAGMQEGRRGEAHMHLLGPGLPQDAPPYAPQVVPRTMESSTITTRLPSHRRERNGVQLDAHGVLPLLLPRLNERAADIACS